VLYTQADGQVGNDNCVRWRGASRRSRQSPLRPHFVRATVRLHQYPDGSIAPFKGPHRRATFPAAAEPPQELAA
jgi:hypothetical protein